MQYGSSDKLRCRISIHETYSTNPQGFANWIQSNYRLPGGARILELGCGTGVAWAAHLDRLTAGMHLYLTDASEAMVDTTRCLLGEDPRISYQVVDIMDIPFDDASFDVVIANMMLYHVPDIGRALREVDRVLADEGCFYAATYGENSILAHIARLIGWDASAVSDMPFTLQNGGAILARQFPSVERLDYSDSLAIDQLDDLLDYLASLQGLSTLADVDRTVFKPLLEAKMVDGVLMIPKEYGMFVAGKVRG